ncbi:MAG TPA: hypothetical protein VH854_07640 [Thermoanaerobaculia bacterium]|jgi:hypothetical protein|nr:hypothetical protein [Thermoanaerobaculia bacterium]
MSGRRLRNLVLLAAVAAIGWWIYKDRPTASGLIDSITSPLLGSHAAVKSSERNRVVGDANTSINDGVEIPVSSLKEGMTGTEVRDLLGDPQKTERFVDDGGEKYRWTYTKAERILTMKDNRVIGIEIIR